ncbi:DUF4145 domain-containing protein [Pseudomonas sp. SWRI59]|nr:DUF4145 domain-containing protein [Pseudomonas sp. SWRI59]MBC3509519.1 DUF4145 domain-containing protein [Pseudomonas sp. SWRI68]
MSREHTPPTFHSERFHCPHPTCGAFAHMVWSKVADDVSLAACSSCDEVSIWRRYFVQVGLGTQLKGTMLFPTATSAPAHHPDMPEDIRSDYEEARLIWETSPRGSAALLRLVVEKLCNHLVGKKGDINNQIGTLVKTGLSPKVQKALDSIRVIGNEAVHPGTMDLNDTPELALALFRLVNLIVQSCITDPREADEIYSALPEPKRKGIEQRDKPKE